MLMQVKILSK